MKAIPLIRAIQLKPYLTFLEQIGANSNRFLEQSKIKIDILNNPKQLLPEYQVWNFIQQIGQANGSAIEFGLQVGKEGSFDFLLELIYPSLTAYDALKRLCLLTKLHSSQANLWLCQKKSTTWFFRQGIREIAIGQQAVEAYTLMLMINLVQYTTGQKDWKPSNIWLQMKENGIIKQFKLLENTSIKYNQEITGIAIDTTLLSFTQPPLYSPPVHSLMNSAIPESDFLSSLRQVIQSLSAKNYPNLNEIAQVTGISSRTLQRRLKKIGMSYTELTNQIQFERAKTFLKNSDLNLKEISRQLGYSTQGHFSRAFKGWTGTTPQYFRYVYFKNK